MTATTGRLHEPERHPASEALPPPRSEVGVLGWLRQNLFSDWFNSLLTLLAIYLIYAILRPALTWAFTTAQWQVVATNLRLFMRGQYPPSEVWRLWVAIYLLALLVGLSWGVWGRAARTFAAIVGSAAALFALLPLSPSVRLNWVGVLATLLVSFGVAARALPHPARLRPWLIAGWASLLPATIVLTAGIEGVAAMPRVPATLWGGLLLTLMLTIIGNTLAFPLGVVLALGRRSPLPIIRALSTAYIELVRGVPLVTILFMADILLPLFLSAGVHFDSVVRAIVGLTLFEAAYQAENVRGGLQAIPRGQYEAARALGLNSFLTTAFIILPQAIRLVIPALLNSFISLFKDTSLVSLLGLFDLMLIGRAVIAQPQFLGRYREVYLFLFVVYWVFSMVFSYASGRLEKALGVGVR